MMHHPARKRNPSPRARDILPGAAVRSGTPGSDRATGAARRTFVPPQILPGGLPRTDPLAATDDRLGRENLVWATCRTAWPFVVHLPADAEFRCGATMSA